MLCTNIVLNVKTKTKKQFLFTTCCELVFLGEFNEQSLVILWVNWCKNDGFWKRFTCTNHGEDNSTIVADSKTLEERIYSDLDKAETSGDDDPKTVLKPETSKRKKQEDIATDSDELEGNTYRVIGLMFTF